MIFSITLLLLVVYAFFNYKRAFLLYLLLDVIWFPNAKIINMSGLPSITVYLIGSMAFVNIYLVKKKKIHLKSTCPYFTPLLLLSISRFLTCTTSVTGFSDEFSRAIGYLFYSVLQVLLIWKALNKEEDFYFIFKGYIVIFFISGIYGIVEYITRLNPIFQYKS